MSLRLRLVLALAPLFILGVVIADAVTYGTLHTSLVSQLDNELLNVHQTIEQTVLQANGVIGGRGGPQPLPPGAYGAILSTSGQLALQPVAEPLAGQSTTTAHPLLPTITSSNIHQYLDAPGTGGVSSYRVYIDDAAQPGIDGLRVNGLLVVALPADNVNATLNQILLLELLVTGVLTLLVGAATWWIVQRGLQPLERMATTARSIAASDLSRRVEPSTESTEVGRLGIALNTMLTQLEAAFAERQRNEQRLRHFISDASHELRTPLTSVQGYAELLQRAREMDPADVNVAMRRIESETQRMAVLVDDLLLLARLDQGRPLQSETVDLDALVRDACADARVSDPQRVITPHLAAPLVVTGDEMRLRQVLSNLVRNALVHTPLGTPVEVTLRPDAGRAVLEVVDHGRGVPPEERMRIFERFHRADPELSGDQGGSGLGLSIVAAVVAAHGGTVTVLDTPGGGATFRVELPMFDAVPTHPAPKPPPPPLP